MQERDFWAQSSGLTPVANYSIGDHERAAWAAKTGSSSLNYDDLRYAYLLAKGIAPDSANTMLHRFWASLSALTPISQFSVADHRNAALALNPLVP